MSDKDIGLYNRYHIQHSNGKPIDPRAEYFVLRLDGYAELEHRVASIAAVMVYAQAIQDSNPTLAKELLDKFGDDTCRVIEASIKKAIVDISKDTLSPNSKELLEQLVDVLVENDFLPEND